MKIHILSFVFVFSLGTSIQTFAQTMPITAPRTSTISVCPYLADTCQHAGYTKYGTTGNNIMINCIAPLLNGQKIIGVNATPMQIQACKTEINNLPCAKIITACRTAGFTGGPGKLTMFDCAFPIARGKTVAGVNPDPDELKICKDTMDKQIQTQPCMRVMLACKDAGYSPDPVNGTVFARNCYGPILDGKQVPGVLIDAATAKACSKQSPSGTQPGPAH